MRARSSRVELTCLLLAGIIAVTSLVAVGQANGNCVVKTSENLISGVQLRGSARRQNCFSGPG